MKNEKLTNTCSITLSSSLFYPQTKPLFRADVIAWMLGVIFIILLLIAVMLIGDAKGWDADSGFTHNTSETSEERFLSEPYVEEPGVIGRCGVGAPITMVLLETEARRGHCSHQDYTLALLHLASTVCLVLHLLRSEEEDGLRRSQRPAVFFQAE